MIESMKMQTVTIEVGPQVAAILLTLQQRAEAEGKTLHAILRELVQENEKGAEPSLAEIREERGAPTVTPFELAEDLIGVFDSTEPLNRPQRERDAFGRGVIAKLEKQGLKLP